MDEGEGREERQGLVPEPEEEAEPQEAEASEPEPELEPEPEPSRHEDEDVDATPTRPPAGTPTRPHAGLRFVATAAERLAEEPLSQGRVAELVSRVPVFKRVAAESPAFVHALAKKCTDARVSPGTLFAKGDPADEMYFIVSGTVQIRLELHIPAVAELHGGDILGEGALFVNAPRSAYAVASEGTRLLRLSKHALEDVLPQYPQVEHELAEFAMGRLARPSSRLAGSSSWTKPMPKLPRAASKLYELNVAKGTVTHSSFRGAPAFGALPAADKQRYEDLASKDFARYREETSETGARTAFRMIQYRDPAALKAIAVWAVAPVVGVLPFLVPMQDEARRCRLGANETTATVSCATVEPNVFAFVVLPIWLLLCTGFFLELIEPQFKHIGFDEEDAADAAAGATVSAPHVGFAGSWKREGHHIGFAGSWRQKTLIIVGSQGWCAVWLGVLLPAFLGMGVGGDLGTLAYPEESSWMLDSWSSVKYIVILLTATGPVWFVIARLIWRTSKLQDAHEARKAHIASSLGTDSQLAVHHVRTRKQSAP